MLVIVHFINNLLEMYREIRNHSFWMLNYPNIEVGETLTGDSETTPGQGITAKEVVNRFVNKKPLAGLSGVFNQNHLLPDNFERLDKVERIELAQHMRALIANRQERLQARRAKPSPTPSDPNPAPESAKQPE